MDIFDLRTLINLGAYVLGMGVTIAVVRNDIKWIKRWTEEHDRSDDERFREVRQDIRELRRHAP